MYYSIGWRLDNGSRYPPIIRHTEEAEEGFFVEEGLVRYCSPAGGTWSSSYVLAAIEWKLLRLGGNAVTHPGLYNSLQVCPSAVSAGFINRKHCLNRARIVFPIRERLISYRNKMKRG